MKTSGLLLAVLVAVATVFSGQTTIRSQSVTGSLDGVELTTASAQQAKLVAADGAPGDLFGSSVAMAGDLAFAGAPGAGGVGAVYVFQRTGNSWVQLQKLAPSDAPSGGEFGTALSLSMVSGTWTLVVGAPGVGGGTGAAYVFVGTPGATGSEQQKLTATPTATGAGFGKSVAVFGDDVVVGAPFEHVAYAFVRTGSVWSQTQRIVATPTQCCFGGNFGTAVALKADLLTVGAPTSQPCCRPSAIGAVFSFVRSGSTWTQAGAASGTINGARYGSLMAFAGDVLGARHREVLLAGGRTLAPPSNPVAVAGAPGLVLGGYSGSATLFSLSASSWDYLETLTASDALAAGFGASVALSGPSRLVGAPATVSNTGSAYVFLAPTTEPMVVGFGAGSGGVLQSRGAARAGFARVAEHVLPWPDYSARNGEIRPAVGDVDGDGLDEVVIGLGAGADGWLAVLDDAAHGYALLRWIQVPWPAYNAANGSTWPAVGDIDGDGRAEIVVGLGEGAGGWFAIFDDLAAGHALMTWKRVSWSAYNAGRGETRPAIANIDGGSYSEIVIGLGPTGGGWLELFDDAGAGFAPLTWLRSSYGSYNESNGETFPAAGDLDEDGFDEIVIGLGRGSGGWVEIVDDAFRSFGHRRWLQVGWAEYNTANGEVHPAVGNVDSDSRPELVLGLGANPGQGGWIQILDDAVANHVSLAWKPSENGTVHTSGAASFPAVGRFR